MAEVVVLIWAENEAEYLCRHDWTGQISLIRHEKLDFRREGMAWLLMMRIARGWFAVARDGDDRGSDIQARRADQRRIIATEGFMQNAVKTRPQGRSQLNAA
jgi:hypothetical protein